MPSAADRERLDVFVAGLLFHDLVFAGFDHPPKPGTETWTRAMTTGPGGIANFACALRRLGLRTGLAAAFGDDAVGRLCWDALADEGVDLTRSRRFPGWATPTTVSLAYDGDRSLVTHGSPPPLPADELVGDPPPARAAIVHLRPEPVGWPSRCDGLVFGDVGWDPSVRWSRDMLDQLRACHAFTPNAREAMAYTRTDSPAAALSKLAELVPLAVVTCGGEGAVGVDATTGETAQVAGLPADVVDPTGAGDVFGAGLVVATLAGWPLAQRLRFANLVAALSVGALGGAPAAPRWADIARWWLAVTDPSVRRDYAFIPDVMPNLED